MTELVPQMPRKQEWLLRKALKTKQVGSLDKDLPTVIDVVVPQAIQVAAGIKGQAGIEILKIAVIAEIDCCAWMKQVSEENIGVEIFRRLQRCVHRVGEIGIVLANEAKRKLASKLIVPFGTNDVVIEDCRSRGKGPQVRK